MKQYLHPFKVIKENEKQSNFKFNPDFSRNHQIITNQPQETELKSTKFTESEVKNFYENKDNLISFIKKNNANILQDFEILDFITSGSVGTFYEGRYKKGNKQKIGMKFFMDQTRNPKRIKHKNEEISYLRKLKNKNIIGLFGHLKIDDFNSCAILELAKYGDLEHFQNKILKRKYLSETIICYFAKQIIDSLFYIHKCKILHSDIKQSNILIDSNLNIKLTDFSVSTSYKDYDLNKKIIFPFAGTGKFISPEILEKKEILVKDANKIDLYSMGVVLYYLAYGTYPYNLKTVKSKEYNLILKTIKEQKKIEFLEDREISDLFKDFLNGVLEIDIEKRFDIKTVLEHPWIKGAKLIMDEKEKVSNLEKFLVLLITDTIKTFNDYISCNDETERKEILNQ